MAQLVVSGAGTGVGKTLVTRALCAALRHAGRSVQPYKIGPDYIDGRLTSRSAGRVVYNVDLWLDGEDNLRRHVAGTRGDADALVFEGMMGLYDGDDDGTTSTAHVAMLLGAPVLLVLDGWNASQTAAAVALGLRTYEPGLAFAGAILNRTGGAAHTRAVADACARAGVALLATLPFEPDAASPERRLGLDRAEGEARTGAIDLLGRRLAEQLDLDALLPRSNGTRAAGDDVRIARARVAVAEDEAFWFTYPETLIALRAAGADVVPFSPVHDTSLPDRIDGLWLGGGYPELHAAALAKNVPMRDAVRRAVREGLPAYAECGGMMYLAESLETEQGTFPMAGALQGSTSIARPRLTIGYRRALTLADGPLDARDTAIRGYEFHYASGTLAGSPAYAFQGGGTEGIGLRTLTASFMHRHFVVGDPAIERFVASCAR
jgi:cobyrinic acid a,c-diamide synthase